MKMLNLLVITTIAWVLSAMPAQAAQSVLAVTYHDVVDEFTASSQPDAVTLKALAQQLQWLKREGYTAVTVAEVIAAREGRHRLPAKPVLLCFDDGYRSFYTHAFPLLRAMRMPSVLAVVGSWHLPEADGRVHVNGSRVEAEQFMSPEQLREVARSGLVEIVSHTFAQHEELQANPQGGKMPAVITRRYEDKTGNYESEAAYQRRLQVDLQRNVDFIKSISGKAPNVVVWPFGRYNGTALRAARATGHVMTLTLDETSGVPDEVTQTLGRKYIHGNPTLGAFSSYLLRDADEAANYRHLGVRLDRLLPTRSGTRSPTADDADARLSRLLDEVAAAKVNAVLVNPFGADCDAFFDTAQRSVAKDVLTRVVWQMHTRLHVRVFLELDVNSCLQPATAEQEVRRMAQAAPFSGLVLRANNDSAAAAQALADVFVRELPGRPVASNVAFAGRSFEFQSVSACSAPGRAFSGRSPSTTWVDVDASRCPATAALEALVRAGARSYGISKGTRADATQLDPAALRLMTGLLAGAR